MSSTGSGYDYSCGTFSPDGRIFQVEYAQKAVENSGTAIGIKCSDGILIAVEKPMVSKMLVAGSNRRVFGVDSHAGVAVTGLSADGRQLVNRAREEAQNYQDTYGHKIVPSILSGRLGMFMHYYTSHGSLRPFGSQALIAAYDEDLKSSELYMVEPSGVSFRYFGCAAGKGAQAAKTELEKIMSKSANASSSSDSASEGITVREAVDELAKILNLIRDASKDKPFELEMGWLCEETNNKFALVPKALVEEANTKAKNTLAGQAVDTASAPGSAATANAAMAAAEGVTVMDI
mmetsp:Transcript_94/g.107  ORF Transcript_94/g.107 Transcript_94/m.107 type:complete len:291 (+) Transcript_94:122-994(+)